jgi:Na+/H+-dicarboxylate symporter
MNKASAQKANTSGLHLGHKIFIGMVLGIIAGAILGPNAENLKPIGTLFINAITMLFVPLIFCSVIVGVTSMQDMRKLGRISVRSIVLYLLSTAVAITIGLTMASVIAPGEGLNMTKATSQATDIEAPLLITTLLNIIPKNLVGALSSGNALQIIFFALSLGISLTLIGDKAKPVIVLFNSLAEAMYKLTEIVMVFAPYGVFGLMSWVVGKYDSDILWPLAKLIGLVYVGAIIHVAIVYPGMIKIIGGLSPARYFKGIVNPAAVAFATASSSGTLPVTLKATQEELGVSRRISSFILSVGATVNKDGTALYQGICVLFIAQAFGVDLSASDYLLIIVTSTLASIATAGVPGAGLIMLSAVLTTVGLPLEGLAIIAGIDRILDMARTSVNVCGDMMVATLIGKSEKEIDLDIYNKSA